MTALGNRCFFLGEVANETLALGSQMTSGLLLCHMLDVSVLNFS